MEEVTILPDLIIGATSTMRNEADICEASIRHLLAEGISFILVAEGRSTDGTRDILQDLKEETGRVEWYDDDKPFHAQEAWHDYLAAIAAERGATWRVPFDADEFWCGSGGLSVAEVLAATPPEISKQNAQMFQYHDREFRELDPKPFPKIAHRWNPAARAKEGNHALSGVDGGDRWGELFIREIQYRSYEHFVRKMRERNATIDPDWPADAGWHHRRLAEFTEEQLHAEWDAMCAKPTIYDPIITRTEES